MSMWRFGTGRFVEIDLPAYDVTDTIIKGIYIWLQLFGLVIDNLYTLAFFTTCVVRVTCKLLYRVLWLIVFSLYNFKWFCVGTYRYVRYIYNRACFYHSVLRGIINRDEETWFIVKQIMIWKKAQFKRRSGLIISQIKSIWNIFTSWFHINDRDEMIRAHLDKGQEVLRRRRERMTRRARPWEEALDREKEKVVEPEIPVLSGHSVKELPLTEPYVVLPSMYYDVDFYSRHYRQCGAQNNTLSNTCIDWESHSAASSEENVKLSITERLYLALNPEDKPNPPPVFDKSCFSRLPAQPVFLSWKKRFLEYIQDGPVVLELPDSPSDYSISDTCSSTASRKNSTTQIGERLSALSSALCLSAYNLSGCGYEADNETIETSCRQLVKMLSKGKLFRAESRTGGSSVLTLLSEEEGQNGKNTGSLWQKKASSESEMASISYYMKNKGRRQLPVHGKDSKTHVTQAMSEGDPQVKQLSGSDNKVDYESSITKSSGSGDLFDDNGEIALGGDVESNEDSQTDNDITVNSSSILAAYNRLAASPPRFSNIIYNPRANTPLFMRGLNTQAMHRFLLLNNFVDPADLMSSTEETTDGGDYSDLD